MAEMTSRGWVLTAPENPEPDRLPFDAGSTQVMGITLVAYHTVRRYPGLPDVESTVCEGERRLHLFFGPLGTG